MKEIEAYGVESFERLQAVFLHRSAKALSRISEETYQEYLWDGIPHIDDYIKEHEAYADLLRSQAVQVFMLEDYVKRNIELLDHLPNLAYLHDTAAVSSHGAIISKMATPARNGESIVVVEALQNIGIPIYHRFTPDQSFEGCLLVSPDLMLIANTERHSPSSIKSFIPKALALFKEVLYVDIPQERRYMHPDMIFNRIHHHLALYYPEAYLNTYCYTKDGVSIIDFESFMKDKEIELLAISSHEQMNWGCSFVPLEPGKIINYDFSLHKETKQILRRKGVEVIEFHPEALLTGGGSLRCLTLRLWRSQKKI